MQLFVSYIKLYKLKRMEFCIAALASWAWKTRHVSHAETEYINFCKKPNLIHGDAHLNGEGEDSRFPKWNF